MSKKTWILLSVLEEIIEQRKSQNGEPQLYVGTTAEEIIVTIQDKIKRINYSLIYSALIGSFFWKING